MYCAHTRVPDDTQGPHMMDTREEHIGGTHEKNQGKISVKKFLSTRKTEQEQNGHELQRTTR